MSAKDDCNALLAAVMPFAEAMLNNHGEFLPFGARMLADGEVELVASGDDRATPASQTVIDTLVAALRGEAARGGLLATAVAYDVRVVPPGSNTKTDAVSVELDHRDNYSVTVFFPYAIAERTATIGPAFANAGRHAVFGPEAGSSEAGGRR